MSRLAGERAEVARLLDEARTGDERAFRRLVDRIHQRLFRWALVVTGDRDLADDATQEALIRVHANLDRYRGHGSPFSWLYRITANTAATTLRQARVRPGNLERSPVEHVAAGLAGAIADGEDPTDGVVGRLYADRITRMVGDAFNGLAPRQRVIFDLVDLQGFEPVEVAEMLDMNPSTVRANLLKARRNVRARILELHPELEGGYRR